jgi:hypothetical protein
VLPLLLTVLLAAYVLGPDLVSRWILGFVVPRRAVVQSKSEELARAVLWSFVPLWLAWMWAEHIGNLASCGGTHELQAVFSGLYSESFFAAHRAEFFASVAAFLWMNWCLLWRLYLMVIAGSIALSLVIRFYGPIRQRLTGHRRLQSLLAILVLPRVSDWHVLLSRMLLPSKDVRLYVDLLTKSDQLYQGRLADKTLGPDGSLVSVTLGEPSKFRRERYLEAGKDGEVEAQDYWKRIPGEMFVVMASDIATLNIRYGRPTITQETAPEVIATLRGLLARLEQPRNDSMDVT